MRLSLAILSGLVLAAAFPPWDLGWLGFVGLVPLLLAVDGLPPWRGAALGYLGGLAFFLAAIWWVINTMTAYGRMPLALSVSVLLLLCGVLAAYVAAFTWLWCLGRERLHLSRALWPWAAAALWTGLEFLRTYLFSGFPWALLGYTQYRQPTVRLLAAATGVYGISFLLVLVNAALADLAQATLRGGARRERWRGAGAAAGAVLAILVTVGYAHGVWRDVTGGAPFRVGLLQGNIDQAEKWSPTYQQATLDIYERLARQAAADGAQLIVWPEAAVPFLLRYDAALGQRVVQIVQETHVANVIGSPDLEEDRLLYNAAFLVAPDGRLLGRYDKRHLVPFGEYVPLQSLLFFVHKLAYGIGDFGRGRTATVSSLDGLRFSVMICYEAIFPAEVREFVERGAQLLVNITNDAWFGRSGAPYQHLAMAAMRAVENGTYLVRAANTGVTAVVAPTGEILAQTPIFTEAVLVGTIRPRLGTTPYTRYGDVLGWACLVWMVGYAAVVWRAGYPAADWVGRRPGGA